MDRRFLLLVNGQWARSRLGTGKMLRKGLFPLGSSIEWLSSASQLLIRYRSADGQIKHDPQAKIYKSNGAFFLRSDHFVRETPCTDSGFDFAAFLVEGSVGRAQIIGQFAKDDSLDSLARDQPTLRLGAYGLPPIDTTTVTTPDIVRAISASLKDEDTELFARRTDGFVRYPHILIDLLGHVMELRSRDQIEFVSALRCVSDQLRELLSDRIVKIEKSHRTVWSEWRGARISYADGGVSEIAGLPGSEPMGMRVGIYSVTPGESDGDKREAWYMSSYVAGDIVNVPVDIGDGEVHAPDRRRLREAARYVLEALTALEHATADSPSVLFVHGPLVNSFLMYDEADPHYIPSIDPDFLHRAGIDESAVVSLVSDIPSDYRGKVMWNHCMAVYPYLMRKLFSLNVPVIGVVERSGSHILQRELILQMTENSQLLRSHAQLIRRVLDGFRITDELLFGCVLDEGEYIRPTAVNKNQERRARDRWQPVVHQLPCPASTYIKTSSSSFPFRVEINKSDDQNFEHEMALLYHTSRLLPRYAFPVGLDIADKFAKVPDWLSRGVSAAVAAEVLSRAAATGQPRVLQQVRQLLAQPPRDFYYRPQA